MDCSTPGLSVSHQLPEPTQTHDHWVSDAIQISHWTQQYLIKRSETEDWKSKSSLTRWHCLVASVVSDSATPWTVTHQAPLSMGSFPARVLEWVTMPFFKGSSQPRDQTWISCISGLAGEILYHWATREAPSSFRARPKSHTSFHSL